MSTKTETAKMTISKANVELLVEEAKTKLATPKDSCPTEHYNNMLGYCIAKLISHDPAKTLVEVAEIWGFFPKSPSAMRQHLWESKKEKATAANNLAALLMK